MLPVAAGFEAAGFVFPAFLFCDANAVVPASANAKTALISILFIIVLRRFFLAVNSTTIAGAILVKASHPVICKTRAHSGSSYHVAIKPTFKLIY
jgi:hypothetical protein